MLNLNSIERALRKYADCKDADVAARLAIFGALIHKAAQLSQQLSPLVAEFSDADLEAACRGEKVLLRDAHLTIDSESFEKSLRSMAQTFVEAAGLDGEMRAACEEVDWGSYAVPALLKLASTDPMKYLESIEILSPDEDLLDLYVLPVIGYTLRAYLDATATAASGKMAAMRADTVHEERPMKCPVCGGDPSIAAVVGTNTHGNVKKLYCTCCGANWQFERIRCATCGDEATSDLTYVHDERDQAHRLHVCKGCGAAMPTVFAGEELQFNPDIEQIVMSGLESFWAENHQEPS